MGRSKKIKFKLEPGWMLKEPLDFEYNKYILLNYIQKCEKVFNNFEIYPDFIELSLHLANIQSLYNDNKLLVTEKKFKSYDDEILLKDLSSVDTRTLTEEEEIELQKTIKFSGNKLFEMFNVAKSVWTLAFENIDLYLRKNKDGLNTGYGYVFYLRKDTMTLYIWEYYDKTVKKGFETLKINFKLIHEGQYEGTTIAEIIEEKSSFNKTKFYTKIPIFEVKTSGVFPMEQTLLPIIKRKLTSYLYQLITFD